MNNDVVYPNYSKCVTNLACSILKHFELDYNHNSLEVVDLKLATKDYKNVILLIYDGLGSAIVKSHLPEGSFLRSHIVDEISSVLPSTTVAATTSLLTGLHPVEHGWMGWNVYIKQLNEIVIAFTNKLKDTETDACTEHAMSKYLPYKSIIERINEAGKQKAYGLFPFGADGYKTLDDFTQRILDLADKDGKKYIYAYCNQPDKILHRTGTQGEQIKALVSRLNEHAQDLAGRLQDTLLIVTADHGHVDVEQIFLKRDYPDFTDLLERNTALEGRACAFWIKQGRDADFVEKFNELFSNDFLLFTKKHAIEKNFFGDGKQHENFECSIGDYIALAISNKYFEHSGYESVKVSHHGGIVRDEMIVPLILISR